MRTLILTCKCGQQMKVPENVLGRTGICVGCGKRLNVTKRNTTPCEQEAEPKPDKPVEGEPALTDVQKVTQALTSRKVETPPGWQEFENMYAAREKAASRHSFSKKDAVLLGVVLAATLCVIVFATRIDKQGAPTHDPNQLAEAFFTALIEGRFRDASQCVFPDDRTGFHEKPEFFESLKASYSHVVQISLDNSGRQGEAKCWAVIDAAKLRSSGDGQRRSGMEDHIFFVGLEYIDGHWWIRL